MNRKHLVLGIFIAFLVILLTACINDDKDINDKSTANKQEPVTISFWVPGSVEAQKDYFIQAVDEFNRSQEEIKVLITLLPGPPQQIELKLNAAQMGKFYPDVFSSYLTFIGTRGTRGEFADLTDYYNDWEDKDDILDTAINRGKVQNKLVGIGYYPSPEIMVYRKDLFEETGLDPDSPPTSWKEIADFAIKLTKRDEEGNVIRAGIDIPLVNGSIFAKIFMRQNGANIINEFESKVMFNQPAALEALEYIYDLKNENVSIPYDWSKKERSPFYKGDSAMAIINISAIKKLLDSDVKFKEYIGFVPIITEKVKSTYCGYRFLAIGEDSKHKDESWEFIKFLMSKEEMIKRSKILGVPVVRQSLIDEYINIDPIFNQVVLDYVEYGKGQELVPWILAADKYLNTAIEEIYTQQKSISQAMQDAQNNLQKEITVQFKN